MNHLGAFVSERRKSLGLRQQDLADALGYTVQAISKFENGQSQMDIASLPKLAQVLKLSLEDLLKQNDNPASAPCSITFSAEVVSANLVLLRQSVHASQSEVATWMSVSKRSVANYESGASLPSATSLVGFLSHFNVTADDFFAQKLSPQIPPKKSKSLQKPLLITLGVLLLLGIVIGSTSPLWISKKDSETNSLVSTNSEAILCSSSSSSSMDSAGSSSSPASSSSNPVPSSSTSSSPTSSLSSSTPTSGELSPNFPGITAFYVTINGSSDVSLVPGTYPVEIHTPDSNGVDVSVDQYEVTVGLSAPVPRGFKMYSGSENHITFTLESNAGDGISITCGPVIKDPRSGNFMFGTQGLKITAVNPGY